MRMILRTLSICLNQTNAPRLLTTRFVVAITLSGCAQLYVFQMTVVLLPHDIVLLRVGDSL